jgi:type VI secretion system secreted protein Hcp
MASVIVQIPGIPGESRVAGFEDAMDAVSIRDTIDTASATGARANPSQNVGRAKFSDVEITRVRDRASPKIAEACSAGSNLGEVRINLIRQLGGIPVVYMSFTLGETFVSRVEFDTVEESGQAYQPHLDSVYTSPASVYGAAASLATIAKSLRQSQGVIRVAPRALVSVPRGASTNTDVERVWFNAATVRWTYTPFVNGVAGGSVERGFNIQQGMAS